MAAIDPRDRMFIALDVPTLREAEALVDHIGDAANAYKIGYQLVFAGGLDFARDLARAGKRVFLDMKLHDIGNTVEKGVENIAAMGMTYLTVHAFPQTMRAAVKGRGSSPLKILAVTVMTSYDDADLVEAGYQRSVSDLVALRAAQARDIGIDGLILSPHELTATRSIVGPAMHLVTPGVRPAGGDIGDQKRVMTPGEAIRAGADVLVVGRPITAAADPRAAAQSIVSEISA